MQNLHSIARPIFLTTLQEASTDDACSMKLWYSKFQRGGGLTPNASLLSDEMYQATLSDMRTIALMEDISQAAIQEMIDEILSQLSSDDHLNYRAKELLYRRLGWMSAYALFVEPQIRKIYETIDIEEEADIERESLMVRVQTGGRLLRHKQSNQIEHREFVMTATANAKWRDSWEWNIRPHLNFMAIREGLGKTLMWSRIIGLNTGFVANVENAQLHHPYVYGHFNQTTGEWTHAFKLKDEDGGTWRERPVWDYPGGLTDWVMKVGPVIAEQQFPLSPKIGLNRRLVDEWLQHRLHRERQIQSMKISAQDNPLIRNLHFPRRTDQCAPVHAAQCAFKDLCWSEPFMSAALQSTKFTVNLPLLLTQAPAEPIRPIPTIPPQRQALATLSDLVEKAISEGRAEVVEGFVPITDNPHITPLNIDTLPY